MDNFSNEFVLYGSNSPTVRKSTRNGDPKLFLKNVLFCTEICTLGSFHRSSLWHVSIWDILIEGSNTCKKKFYIPKSMSRDWLQLIF